MGVYKRQKNSRWYVVFYDEETKDRTERALGTEDEDLAELKRDNLERKWEAGEIRPFADKRRKNVALTDAAEFFFDHLERHDRAASTLKTYRGCVRRLIEHTGDKPIVNVDSREVESYCKQEDLSQATHHKRFRHVRAFFNFLIDEDLLSANPCEAFDVREPKKRVPKAVTKAQLDRICASVRSDYHAKKARRGGMNKEGQIVWRIPIFRFAFFSGLRRGEISRLRWKHLDLEENYIYIFEQKNNEQDKIPLLHPAREVVEELKEEGQSPEAFVFTSPSGDPFERNHEEFGNNLSNKFKHYVEKADVPGHLTFHGLRHGFCTHLAKQDVNPYKIQRMARHADLSTTMQYVHLADQDLKDAGNDAFDG
ncbi:integrase [Salinibacter phage M8CRM-1]|uniref:Integrase n=1 Tax=Salinibacter phage M8CRM-1 TaxID=2681612 RepID=A0A2I6UGM5_9CAUD|nr:integrase [Salinibacter phage M8CRM-1]AUO79120.1 integrase [Salinibacter phage M8CRM-1]